MRKVFSETLYSGYSNRTYTPIDVREKYPEVDRLMKAGKYAEAHETGKYGRRDTF